jgi:hypothetical protein
MFRLGETTRHANLSIVSTDTAARKASKTSLTQVDNPGSQLLDSLEHGSALVVVGLVQHRQKYDRYLRDENVSDDSDIAAFQGLAETQLTGVGGLHAEATGPKDTQPKSTE